MSQHGRKPSYGDQLVMLSKIKASGSGANSPAYSNPLFLQGENGTSNGPDSPALPTRPTSVYAGANGVGTSMHIPSAAAGATTTTSATAARTSPRGPEHFPFSSASYEADVVEPFIQSLRSAQQQQHQQQQNNQQLYAQIAGQMGNLYEFFKKLYDQDKREIKELSTALKAKDAQVAKLAADHTSLLGVAEEMQARERELKRSVAAEKERADKEAAEKEKARARLAERSLWMPKTLVFFLPYHLHPSSNLWRFYAAWHHSWSTRRTTWLAAAWTMVFILSVGLLVGLLVPWHNLKKTSFRYGSPVLLNTTATAATFRVAINRDNAKLLYAVIPQYAIMNTRRRLLFQGINPASLSYEDLQALVGLREGAGLEEYAVACGSAALQNKDANYTLTIASLAALLPEECAGNYNITGTTLVPFPQARWVRGRCLRCPVLVPGVPYEALIAAGAGRRTPIKRVPFTLPAA